MCGRFTLTIDLDTVIRFFKIHLQREGFYHSRRYNVAPAQDIPVITGRDSQREISSMRWGFIPHWAKDKSVGYKMINARAETIDQKPAFKSSFRHRRCLIPADGFYEWKKQDGSKVPMRIILPDKEIFAFAGIWSHWSSPEGEDVFSCSIITTEANPFVKQIHDRMPVILSAEQEYSAWLGLVEAVAVKELLQPYRGPMTAYRVSTAVNSPKTDGPQLIEKVV